MPQKLPEAQIVEDRVKTNIGAVSPDPAVGYGPGVTDSGDYHDVIENVKVFAPEIVAVGSIRVDLLVDLEKAPFEGDQKRRGRARRGTVLAE